MMSLTNASTTNIFAAMLLALAALPAGAKERRERDQAALPAAVQKIERETGGQVLRAERVDRDGRDVNRIKVITPEGRVRVYRDEGRRESGGEQERKRDGRR